MGTAALGCPVERKLDDFHWALGTAELDSRGRLSPHKSYALLSATISEKSAIVENSCNNVCNSASRLARNF